MGKRQIQDTIHRGISEANAHSHTGSYAYIHYEYVFLIHI